MNPIGIIRPFPLTIVPLDAYQSNLSYFVAVILWAQTPSLEAAASFSQPPVCVVLLLIFHQVSSDHVVTCSSINEFKNFRPASNLKAPSKIIIQKRVALQLNNYLTNNNLHETFQSAYKVHHSTETVMVKVQDDILHGIDSNRAVVLFMLDLSAAFDTVSHEILLNRLTQRYGITGSLQKWFASYLLSSTQFVQIECSIYSLREVNCGVPQGSVLGPLLYVLYALPVAA